MSFQGLLAAGLPHFEPLPPLVGLTHRLLLFGCFVGFRGRSAGQGASDGLCQVRGQVLRLRRRPTVEVLDSLVGAIFLFAGDVRPEPPLDQGDEHGRRIVAAVESADGRPVDSQPLGIGV